jgi:hypothetical protein
MGMSTASPASSDSPHLKPTLAVYGVVSGVVALWGIVLAQLIARAEHGAVDVRAMLPPLYAQVALTGAVWALMVIVRNYAILRELVDANYYVAYKGGVANDWVERPARTFNNLLQVPVLFFVACVVMMQTGKMDSAQVSLAWAFVFMRTVHAVVYIGWNHVPTRFSTWLMSGIALAVLWFRLVSLG